MDIAKVGFLVLMAVISNGCSQGNASANRDSDLHEELADLRKKHAAALEAIEEWRELHQDLKLFAHNVDELEAEVERFRAGDNWRDVVPDLESAMETAKTEAGTLLIKASTAEMVSEDAE